MDINFLHAGHFPECKAYTKGKYFEDYYSLCYISRGMLKLSYEGSSSILQSGTVFLFYPGPYTSYEPLEGKSWEHRYAAFRGPRVQYFLDKGLLPFTPTQAPKGLNFLESFDRLIESVSANDFLSNIRATNLLESLLIQITAQKIDSNANPWLQQVTTFLEEQALENINYESLARKYHMSLSHLRRQFKEACGFSLHEYTLRIKMSKAKNLLRNTKFNSTQIALELGYSDPAFFFKQFKTFEGYSPSQYRDRIFEDGGAMSSDN